MRMRKKKNLHPRMEACQSRWITDPAAQKGHWQELYPQATSIQLEIGCGKGRFTMETAKNNPDVLLIAVEKVPDAMVVAMERCRDAGLTNVFFIDSDAAALPDIFDAGEVDRIYLNFSDPWPRSNQARRRLTHGNFLQIYRKVLKMGCEIHFKSDNDKLFAFSEEEIPRFGFTLSEVTHDLHANGPVGVMTDYEAKFYAEGKNINRLVATMIPWEPPFPASLHELKVRWVDAFAIDVDEVELGRRVLAENNYLWHLFSWNLRPHLVGTDARAALPEEDCWFFYCEYPPEDEPIARAVTAAEAAALADSKDGDWYLVDKFFTWTYAHTHEANLGPYFCKR